MHILVLKHRMRYKVLGERGRGRKGREVGRERDIILICHLAIQRSLKHEAKKTHKLSAGAKS